MGIESKFKYDQKASLDVRYIQQDGLYNNLTFRTPFGYRRAAYLIGAEGKGPYAAVLYVHWLEASDPTSNRSQFLDEARRLSKCGVVSLLVETMWSDQDWFFKRSQADDEENTIRQVIELRCAMDLLLSQPGVDPQRFAYVGHDFGAMYGVLAGSIDPRPTCYVLMAGTPRFANWYLYYPKLEGKQRQAYIENMDKYDPINHVAELSPAPLFFQFARNDIHVPVEQVEAFYHSAKVPRYIRWYDAKHKLDESATNDRIAWLSDQLNLVENK